LGVDTKNKDMNKKFKPTGYNSVSPYFVVNGAQKLVDILQQIFGAKELRRFSMPDGTIMHLELQLDDSIIMLGDSSDQFPPNQHLIHVYVPDVDEIYNKAINIGCIPLEPPKQNNGEPNRRGSFRDFCGNVWAIATQIELPNENI
jgi:PhnB protein